MILVLIIKKYYKNYCMLTSGLIIGKKMFNVKLFVSKPHIGDSVFPCLFALPGMFQHKTPLQAFFCIHEKLFLIKQKYISFILRVLYRLFLKYENVISSHKKEVSEFEAGLDLFRELVEMKNEITELKANCRFIVL